MHIAIAIAFSLLGLASSQTFIDECKPCRLENCPPLQEPCLSGVVKDSCNCCTQCGRLENEKCDNETLPLPSRHQFGLCGENLICALRKDLKAGDAEALCTCKEPGMVCGNDARTYATVCNLREVAAKSNNENLFMQDWGPCKSFPIIVSGPENVTEHITESVAISCEVKGFPVPTITWEVETSTGKKLNLPSDDPAMAVQVRGGPEPFMITSWVQIMELRATDSGTYTCIAKNSEGEVRASAQLGVNKVRSPGNGKTSSKTSANKKQQQSKNNDPTLKKQRNKTEQTRPKNQQVNQENEDKNPPGPSKDTKAKPKKASKSNGIV